MEEKTNLVELFHPAIRLVYNRTFGHQLLKENVDRCYCSTEGGIMASWKLWMQLYVLQAIMFVSMMLNKTKGAHGPSSVVARGDVLLDSNVLSWFGPKTNQKQSVLIRHTYSQSQHAHPMSKSVKSMALQMDSLVLTLLSGRACPFFNVETFQAFLHMQQLLEGHKDHEKEVLQLLKRYPCLWNAALAVPPRGSQSYLDLEYSTMMCYVLQPTHELVKFHIRPRSFVNMKHDYQRIRDFPKYSIGNFYDEESKSIPHDVYEKDYQKQLSKGPISYSIWYQKRPNTLPNRNPSLPWMESTTPFLPFATLSIHSMEIDNGETFFDITQLPPALTIPDANCCEDPNVIGHIRKNLYPALQRYRKWFLQMGWFGSM